MNAAHLKEAQQIVDAVAWLESALKRFTLPDQNRNDSLTVQTAKAEFSHNSPVETVVMTAEAKAAAFNVMRRAWELRLADRKRRAAQIGLAL